jgi:hypothetical protein
MTPRMERALLLQGFETRLVGCGQKPLLDVVDVLLTFERRFRCRRLFFAFQVPKGKRMGVQNSYTYIMSPSWPILWSVKKHNKSRHSNDISTTVDAWHQSSQVHNHFRLGLVLERSTS